MLFYKFRHYMIASVVAFAVSGCIGTPVQAQSIDIKDIDGWRKNDLYAFTGDGQWVAKLSSPSQTLQDFIANDIDRAKATYPEMKKNFEELYVLTISNNSGKSYTITSHAAFGTAQFSEDGDWFGILKPQKQDEGQDKSGGDQGAIHDFVLVNLRDGDQQDIKNVTQFEFAGGHVFMRREHGNAALFAKSLASSNISQMGPATELAINNQRTHIAWAISSDEGFGNGIYTSTADLASISKIVQDSAEFSALSWSERGDALTALKTPIKAEDSDGETNTGPSVIAVSGIISQNPKVHEVGSMSNGYPKDFEIAVTGGEDEYGYWVGDETAALWSKDGKALLLQLQKGKKKEAPASDEEESKDRTVPDLAFWHWQQVELPSQKGQDDQWEENRTFPAVYWIEESKLVPLQTKADPESFNIKGFEFDNINTAHNVIVGVQEDDRLVGRLKQNLMTRPGDVYLVNTRSGDRKKVLSDIDTVYSTFSPNGNYFAFWEDGHFFVYDIEAGKAKNITENLPASFVNDDLSNIERVPVAQPRWTKENGLVLEDNWNLWHINNFFGANGPVQTQLTKDGLDKRIDYSVLSVKTHHDLNDYKPNAYSLPDEKPLDDTFVAFAFEKRSLRAGYVRVSIKDQHVTWLKKLEKKAVHGDATVESVVDLIKTNNHEKIVFIEETFDEKKISLLDPITGDEKELLSLAWSKEPTRKKIGKSSGVKIVNYMCNWDGVAPEVAEKEGSLVLPANYKKGRKYPTIVVVYEDRGNIGVASGALRYSSPEFWSSDLITLTSHGYAVFLPDVAHIATKPGISGFQCLMPAVDAALETGIVDEDNMGLHGHSWGGYQTLFYTTQTNRFKAALSGAGLSDLIGMYASVYWGGPGLVQNIILEVGQGRMKDTPWENWQSWLDDSPIYHIDNVETPLLILHNDKDPAVPFQQGMGHFLALQRLQKPAVLLQYRGEGHGLDDRYNQIDYVQRALEFWDHHLKGEDAPQWWSKGIKPSDIDDHLAERFKDVLAREETEE